MHFHIYAFSHFTGNKVLKHLVFYNNCNSNWNDFKLTQKLFITAYLYEINSNYTLAFILAGIPPIIGALLMIYLHKTQKSLRRNHTECLDQIDQFNETNQINEFDEKSPVKIVDQNII